MAEGPKKRMNIIACKHTDGLSYVVEVVPRSYSQSNNPHRVVGRIEEHLGFNYDGLKRRVVRFRQNSLEGEYIRVSEVEPKLVKEILDRCAKRRK